VGTSACVGAAFVIGVALWAGAVRVRWWMLRVVAACTVAIVITGALYFSHAAGGPLSLFYLWATLYVFYFFGQAAVASLTALVGLAYGVALLADPAAGSWGDVLARWGLTMGTVLVSGLLVRKLTGDSKRLAAIVETSEDAILTERADSTIASWNLGAERLYGYTAAEAIGRPVSILVPPDREGEEKSIFARVMQGEPVDSYETRRLRKDGRVIDVSLTVSPVRDRTGQVVAASAIARDITERLRVEEQARRSEEHYRLTFESNPQPMWVFDVETLGFVAVNRAAIEHYGYSEDEFLAMTIADIRPAGDVEALQKAVAQNAHAYESASHWRHRKKDGTLFDVEVTAGPLPVAGRAAKLVVAIDITERRRAERQVRHQADHDPLTELFNRRRFTELLDAELASSASSGRRCSVAMFALDHFKYANDSFGHKLGDTLIQQAAHTLLAQLRGHDVLARIGGDEFAVLMPGADAAEAARTVGNVLAALRARPWHLVGTTTASAGVAEYEPVSRACADDLLVAADLALYEAKDAGRDRVSVYSGAKGGLTFVEQIREAVRAERFVLHAQPILDLRTGKIVQEELLIRMLGVDGELVPPASFIPVAERFGLIRDIDHWVVRKATALARAGRKIEVNISAHSLGDRELTRIVGDGLAAGDDGRNLIFEITETAAASNYADARDFAERLGRLGCGFALDDFGTGFGSFSYLKHVPVSYLKIDMEFVRDLSRSQVNQRVVKAIVQIAEAFGQRTIAEGVEDQMTLDALRAYGVHYAQGYFIGRPAPLRDAPAAVALAVS
jgi:diguanylate cyclase (GGDEF)-like protein/PAS domain S-box-containing protein